jgi:hypothetical protein
MAATMQFKGTLVLAYFQLNSRGFTKVVLNQPINNDLWSGSNEFCGSNTKLLTLFDCSVAKVREGHFNLVAVVESKMARRGGRTDCT